MEKFKIVCCIPARSGSKSIPNKNIVELLGMPLIGYTIIDSIKCKLIEITFVSTDSEIIRDISLQFGAEVPFLRPSELASDTSIDMQWIWHFLMWFENNYQYLPELLIHLRPTTPLREIYLLTKAIQTIQEHPEATSLRSVEIFDESPYKWFSLGDNGFLTPLLKIEGKDLTILPRQQVPPIYRPNGYIDILKPEVVLGGSLHGDRILSFLTPNVIEIDTERDLQLAKLELENYFSI